MAQTAREIELEKEVALIHEQLRTGIVAMGASLFEELSEMADEIDRWAEESQTGGWSTHQVQANRAMANRLRRLAAGFRRGSKQWVGQ